MNIAEFSINKKIITWTLTVLILLMGYFSYKDLPRLEDPEFAIKNAIIITPYFGASAYEVEKEVSEKIEKATQELQQLDLVESYSSRDVSIVKVTIKDKYDKTTLPQVWDELRRKINDYQSQLPPGAGPSKIIDDFGDVYGVYFALTGKDYSYAELKKVAELLKRELLTVKDVKKIVFFGEQREAIYVEISKEKLAALGVSTRNIFNALHAKNMTVDAGKVKLDTEYIPIQPDGLYKSEKDFGELLISSRQGKLIYLKDVATIKRDYMNPPRKILRFNSKPAIGIAISTVMGGNAVKMGQAVEKRLGELKGSIPLGMELQVISMQSTSVTAAVNSFFINLVEAVAIVIIVLLFFMGIRSGFIIGFILILTISGSFIVMNFFQIPLDRVSLGALIIALGMLVDNAIVIVDGMIVKIDQGISHFEAAKKVVGQNAVPLLGATGVAILAFAAIGSMENSTGEYTRSLYYVILISLSISWLTAVTTTPLLGFHFIKVKAKNKDKSKQPYDNLFYRIYRTFLIKTIRHRWITIACVVIFFALSILGFRQIKQMFFPPSTRPQMIVECYFREGMHIKETEKKVAKIEQYLKPIKGITAITASVGAGHPRFLLTYAAPIYVSSNYAILLVSVDHFKTIDAIQNQVQSDLEQMFLDATINVKKFKLGPGLGGRVQLRINGPDPKVLRDMAEKVVKIMTADPKTKSVFSEWGDKVKIIRPELLEDKAIRMGITRPAVAQAIKANFSGAMVGFYREGTEILPIFARAPENERKKIDDIKTLQVTSPMTGQKVPLIHIVKQFTTEMEDARVSRWQRRSMIRIHCDPRKELPTELLKRLKPKIEKALNVDAEKYHNRKFVDKELKEYNAKTIPILFHDSIPIKNKPEYFIAWGGELEDSNQSQAALANYIPIFFGIMVLVVIFLFNSLKQPLIIWLTVPLSIIGVTIGLLTLKQSFGFMSLLGLMSLSGMLIKNAIVLIDQINLDIQLGKDYFNAIIDSGVSRIRPVTMAALTTMLGMLPLFQDDFYISMAVTIFFGLGFATLLTLIVVPVLFATFYRVRAND